MTRGRARLAVGATALVVFVAQTLLLGGMLEWCDAYISTAVRTFRTGEPLIIMTGFTRAAPLVGVAFVLAGIMLARRRITDPREVIATLGQLAVGLLIMWALKGLFERARPGALPWDAGDSFPSGHVANALLCVGTALRLAPRRRGDGSRGLARGALIAGGIAFVLAIAITRVVLARHWVTDVTASLLLGVSFIALAPMPRPGATLGLLLSVPVILLAAWVSVATGSRISLSSPSTLSTPPVPLHVDDVLLGAIEMDDDAIASWGRERFTLLSPIYGKQWVQVGNGRTAILKVLARTHLDPVETTSHRLELLIDGTVVDVQRLDTRWRTLAFALPMLEPGQHQFELLAVRRALKKPPR